VRKKRYFYPQRVFVLAWKRANVCLRTAADALISLFIIAGRFLAVLHVSGE